MFTNWFSADPHLDRVFARLLQHHRKGWGVYKKILSKEFPLGACGYFDGDGDWKRLMDLGNPGELAANNLTPFNTMALVDVFKDTDIWGAKESSHARQVEVGGTVGSTVVAVPVELSVTIKFRNDGEEAAVVMVENPVHFSMVRDDEPLVEWMNANSEEMLRRHRRIVVDHGLWIVTKKWVGRQSVPVVLQSKGATVEFGVSASASGLVELSPSVSVSNSSVDKSTDVHLDADADAEGMNMGKAGVVVFFSGVYFGKPFLRATLKALRETDRQRNVIYRGDGDVLPIYKATQEEDGTITALALTVVPEAIEDDHEYDRDESDEEMEDND